MQGVRRGDEGLSLFEVRYGPVGIMIRYGKVGYGKSLWTNS